MSVLFLRMRINQQKNVTRMQQMSLLTLKYQDERDEAFVNNMKQQIRDFNLGNRKKSAGVKSGE